MRRLGRWLGRIALVLGVVAAALLAPVAYVELACRGEPMAAEGGAEDGPKGGPILPPEHRRPESNTLLTYPEWHIVHAYDDYAAVIAEGDPHEFGFLRAIGGFWSSLCSLTRASAAMGGPAPEVRRMVQVIGVSFTAELLLKAAYEETLGRLAAWARGGARAPLDALSARQAADYAAFLRQVPWYRWDFAGAAAELEADATRAWRDRERRAALGVEYQAKAAYARAIAGAVAATGGDETTLRSVVAGLSPEALAGLGGVTVIGARPQGVEIETPRYRAFTDLAREIAARGGTFVEIAGNDEILLTAIAEGMRDLPGPAPLMVLPRQGNPGRRELRLVPVGLLAALLRDPAAGVEHVHDY